MECVVAFCTRLVAKFAAHASDQTQVKGANEYSILATSMIFEHVALTKGYSTYSPLSSCSQGVQQYVFDTMLDEWRAIVGDVDKTLDEWHPRVREVGVRPFVT
jgi:hypothetical protein